MKSFRITTVMDGSKEYVKQSYIEVMKSANDLLQRVCEKGVIEISYGTPSQEKKIFRGSYSEAMTEIHKHNLLYGCCEYEIINIAVE